MKPWFRYYVEALDDPKVQGLPDSLFKHWINVLCVAGKNDGALPSAQVVAFGLRVSEAKAAEIVTKLAARDLLDAVEGGYYEPHNWGERQFKSDNDPTSAERSRRYRDKRRGAEPSRDDAAARDDTAASRVTQRHQSRTDHTKADQKEAALGLGAADQIERKLLAGNLAKQFKLAYGGSCGPAGERRFKELYLAGENPDPIITAARRANSEMPAEQWLDERAWQQLSLLPEKVPISQPAMNLADELAKIAGQDLGFLEPGWCGAAYRCQQWLDRGWPRELIVAGVTAMVKRKAPEKIGGHAYFEQGLARFIAQQTKPLPQVVELAPQTVEITRGSSAASHDSRSGIVAIADVYSEIRAKTEGQHRRGGDVPEQAVQRLPS